MLFFNMWPYRLGTKNIPIHRWYKGNKRQYNHIFTLECHRGGTGHLYQSQRDLIIILLKNLHICLNLCRFKHLSIVKYFVLSDTAPDPSKVIKYNFLYPVWGLHLMLSWLWLWPWPWMWPLPLWYARVGM